MVVTTEPFSYSFRKPLRKDIEEYLFRIIIRDKPKYDILGVEGARAFNIRGVDGHFTNSVLIYLITIHNDLNFKYAIEVPLEEWLDENILENIIKNCCELMNQGIEKYQEKVKKSGQLFYYGGLGFFIYGMRDH